MAAVAPEMERSVDPEMDHDQPPQVVGLSAGLLPASFSLWDDSLVDRYGEAGMPDAKVAPEPEEKPFVIFMVSPRWWIGIFNYVFNEIAAFFWSAMFLGWLDPLTPWQPGLDLCYTQDMFKGIRIDGKKVKFEAGCCEWFCQWMKNKFLNTITLTLYGRCCGGNKKHDQWMDKHIKLEGHEDEETIYYGASPPGWALLLYMFFNLIGFWFTLRPMAIMWFAKQRCKAIKFGGQDVRIGPDASYCKFWKIYWCGCGWACGGKLKAYLDEHTIVNKGGKKVEVLGALKGLKDKAGDAYKAAEEAKKD